jgi:hypothetical protein
MDKMDFSLGQIKLNLLTNKIKIEALSMGKFLGYEEGAYFTKVEKKL